MTILLDSVILIDHFNSITEATAYLGQVRGKASISVITRAEVLTGFEAPDRQQATALLDRFPLLDITKRGKTGNNVGVYYFMIMLCGLRLRASITALLNTQ